MGEDFDERLLQLSARDRQDNIPLATFVIIIITLGVIGNAVAFLFYGFKERRTITNFLIAALACNDLFVNLVFFDELYVHFEPFLFTSTAACKIIYVANNWVLLNSVSLMLVIAVERYRKICQPFSWQFTQLRAKAATACVTLLTLVLCSKEAFFAEIVPEHILMNDNSTVIGYVCVHSHDKKLKPIIKGSNFVTMFLYLSLFTSIITVYCLIICKIYKVNKATSDNRVTMNTQQEVYEMNETTNSSSNATQSTTDSANDSQNDVNDGSNSKTGKLVTRINVGASTPDGLKCAGDVEQGLTVADTGNTADKRKKLIASSDEEEAKKQAMIAKQKNNPPNKLVEVERRITKMIIVVAIASILSFVPYFLVVLLVPSHNSTEDQLSNMKKKIFRESYKFNGVINPFIMCIFSSNFRQFIKNIFCRCCSIKK